MILLELLDNTLPVAIERTDKGIFIHNIPLSVFDKMKKLSNRNSNIQWDGDNKIWVAPRELENEIINFLNSNHISFTFKNSINKSISNNEEVTLIKQILLKYKTKILKWEKEFLISISNKLKENIPLSLSQIDYLDKLKEKYII